MKIVILDGYGLNPGDLDWKAFEALGDVKVYDYTAPEDAAARMLGAEAVITNKTVLNRTLIEGCGLKGFRIGGASVSQLHAGFLVNDQEGTAADYLALIAHVQKTVQDQTGVWLEPEVRILGEDASFTAV